MAVRSEPRSDSVAERLWERKRGLALQSVAAALAVSWLAVEQLSVEAVPVPTSPRQSP